MKIILIHGLYMQVTYGASCGGIFSASRDKTIKMWQRGNSHSLREFIGHDLVVTAIHLNEGIYVGEGNNHIFSSNIVSVVI